MIAMDGKVPMGMRLATTWALLKAAWLMLSCGQVGLVFTLSEPEPELEQKITKETKRLPE